MPFRMVIVVFGALCVTLTLLRLPFGVDFTDEAYYSAQAYRFFLGDRPFLDDKLVLSTMAFVTEPLLSLFIRLTESTRGIILYFRFAYFALSIVTAWFVFRAVRNFTRSDIAAGVGLVPILYIHHQMPTLSYNTMALHFLTIALFSSLPSFAKREWDPVSALSTTMAVVLMTIVYPPLVVIGAIVWFTLYRRTRPGMSLTLAMAGIALAIVICFSFWIGHRWEAIREIVAVTLKAGGGGGLFKLQDCIVSLWHWIPFRYGLVAIAVSLVLVRRLPLPARVVLVVLFPIIPMVLSKALGQMSGGFNMHVIGYAYYWGLFAPLTLLLVRRDRKLVRPAGFLVAVAWLAGLTTAWSSSYGFTPMGFAIGFFPAMLIALVSFALWADSVSKFQLGRFTLMVVAACLIYYHRQPFKDDSIEKLGTRITDGPFAGLFTSKQRAQDEKLFREDVRTAANPQGRLFVFESMPALYLYSPMRPAAEILYKTCMHGREACIRELETKDHPQNIVIHVKPYRYNLDVLSLMENPLTPNDPLVAYVQRKYTLSVERNHHNIYKRRHQNS